MQTKSLARQLGHYLVPSVLSLLGLSLYILADTFFISLGIGSMGLAALNIALPAYSVVNATGLMIGVGAGVLLAIARSSGQTQRANRIFNTALGLAIPVGVLFTVVAVMFASPIALLLGASEGSAALSATYLRTMLSFSLFFVLNGVLVALVRNDGNPRLAMVSMLVNTLSNIILDAVFILVFHWGMWGAAFATGLSPIIGLCILSLHWVKGRGTLRLERRLPDLRLIPAILRSGASNFILELGNGLVIFLFNMVLMGLSGDIGVAAYGIVANISLVISYLFMGIGQGMQPVVSSRFGEGRLEDCRKVFLLSAGVALLLGILCFAVGQLLPHQLTALFNGENNPELARMTAEAIRVYFTCFLFMGLNICCASYHQSMLQATLSSAISLLRSLILVVAGVFLLPRWLGVTGVWLVVPLAELLTALFCGGLMLHSRRKAPQPNPCQNAPNPCTNKSVS